MVGAAIKKSKADLEELANQYVNEISEFEAFSKTDAAQHIFEAMGFTMSKAKNNVAPVTSVL